MASQWRLVLCLLSGIFVLMISLIALPQELKPWRYDSRKTDLSCEVAHSAEQLKNVLMSDSVDFGKKFPNINWGTSTAVVVGGAARVKAIKSRSYRDQLWADVLLSREEPRVAKVQVFEVLFNANQCLLVHEGDALPPVDDGGITQRIDADTGTFSRGGKHKYKRAKRSKDQGAMGSDTSSSDGLK